jgi:hypothetical protein
MKRLIMFGVLSLMLSSCVENAGDKEELKDNGTRLYALAEAASIQCISETQALVEFKTTIVSSGSVDSAEIHTYINGESDGISGWIEPQDFEHQGRYKGAEDNFSSVMDNGEHSVFSCYVQSGARGRKEKATCSDGNNFTVDCAPKNPCADVEVFGNIIGNKNLCAGNALPIHVKGDFGEIAVITISNGKFSTSISASRSGESCVYQAKYLPQADGNAGAGEYTFDMVGENGAEFNFSATLKCK